MRVHIQSSKKRRLRLPRPMLHTAIVPGGSRWVCDLCQIALKETVVIGQYGGQRYCPQCLRLGRQ